MAVDETELYKQITENFQSVKLSIKDLSEPDPTVESEVTKIYTQARGHRNRLVWFYIWYTIIFTLFVLALITWEGYERVHLGNANFEIIPQWGLNLLVTGMFAQFIGLLKIVTERVWDFKELFSHHFHLKTGALEPQDKTAETE
jgi:hypothetical protein